MGWKSWDEDFGDGLGYLRCGRGGCFGMRAWGDGMDSLRWGLRGMVWDEGLGRWDRLVGMGV